MKGKACSLADLRKIQRILTQKEKLKGQYDALIRCVDKSTVSTWRKAIDVMNTVDLSQLEHIQPTHMREIARHATREDWQKYVDKCESEQLTVTALRNELMSQKKTNGYQQYETCTVEDLQSLVSAGKKFGTIYADPPWPYSNQATRSSTAKIYKTATDGLEEIKALPVPQLTADDCHLHLWTTNAFLFESKAVLEAWGFEYKSVFVWVKTSLGIGNYWRVSHEFMLLGIKGNAKFQDRSIKSWLECDRGEHSRKPDQIRKLIERVSPGPRLELYARASSEGWVSYGDEISKDLFSQEVSNQWLK